MQRRQNGLSIGLIALLGWWVVTSAPAQPPPTTFGERIDVRLVEVEMWATKEGRPVLDLLQGELQMFQDGEPVDIGFFTPPAPLGARNVSISASEAAPPDEEAAESPPGTVAIFLDDAHLAPAHRARVIDELIEWLEQRFDDRTAVTVVRFANSIDLVAPRNAPRELVVRALRQIVEPSGRAVQEEVEERRTLEAIRDQQRRGLEALGRSAARFERQSGLAGGVEPSMLTTEVPCSRQMLRMAEDLAVQVERSARDSIAALGAYAASLARSPGRKMLLLASDGIPLRPGGPAFDLVRTLCDGSGAAQGIEQAIDISGLPEEFKSRPDVLDRQTLALAGESFQLVNPLSAVAAQANADGITIWTLGARGLTTSGVDASAMSRDRTGTDELRQRVDLEAALSSLAADTGGRALLEFGDFGDGLDDLAADLGSSYLLAFLAPRTADGKLHRIRLETTRRGVRLRHRLLWRDISGEDELGELVVAALLHGIDRPGLRASARAQRLVDEAGNERAILRVVVPEEALSLMPADGGGRHGALRLAIAVRPPGGESSPARSRVFAIERSPTVAGAPPKPLIHDIALPALAPGALVVVGLRDEVDGDLGVLRVLVEGP